MKAILFTTLTLCIICQISHSQAQLLKPKDEQKVRAVMKMQEDAWNKGDIDEFMRGYVPTNELTFIGASGPIYGYQKTLERYKKSYPNRQAMGKLKFDILELRKVDKRTAFMIGKFHLTREIGDAKGTFSLVWVKIKKDWKIMSDHTSAE